MSGPVESGELKNLNTILNDYQITIEEGIVVEEDSYYYAFGYPYVLMPEMGSSEITDTLINESYYAIMPISQGMVIGNEEDETITPILMTSMSSFSKKAGFSLETYEKEEGDTDGPFALGVSIETSGAGRII